MTDCTRYSSLRSDMICQLVVTWIQPSSCEIFNCWPRIHWAPGSQGCCAYLSSIFYLRRIVSAMVGWLAV